MKKYMKMTPQSQSYMAYERSASITSQMSERSRPSSAEVYSPYTITSETDSTSSHHDNSSTIRGGSNFVNFLETFSYNEQS